MGFQLGMNGVISYETGGFSPDAGNNNKPDIIGGVGVAIDIAKDVTLNLEQAEADVTTRGNDGWRARVGTLKEGTVEMQIQWDTDNAAFTALITAWLNNAVIGLSVLDETYVATTNGTGLVTNFVITNFTREEALEEAMMVNVTAQPTYSAVVPGWLDKGTFL
jgi:hypothetical protein